MNEYFIFTKDIEFFQLMAINFMAYAGVNLEKISKFDEVNDDFKILIVDTRKISDVDHKELIGLTQFKGKKFILLGMENSDFGVCVKSVFNIREIVRAFAKEKGITAQDMMNTEVPDFFPIPLASLYATDSLFCNIYKEYNEQYEILFEANTIIDRKILKGLRDIEVNTLYINKMNRLHAINDITASIITNLQKKKLSAQERVSLTEIGMDSLAAKLSTGNINPNVVMPLAKECAKSINSAIKDMPKIGALLTELLENKTSFVYMHTILATHVAHTLLDKVSWGNQAQKDKVAFVLFFHDIFLVPLSMKFPMIKNEYDYLFLEGVTDREKEIVLNHASMAGNIVRELKGCPMGADVIVFQHHGMTDGKGIAVHYRDDITPLAKVIIIAEACVEYLLKSMDPREEYNFNVEEVIKELKEKFSNSTYKKIIDQLIHLKV
ncbi:MAG: hypothetical protein H6622_11275 [Halobacteriovoraceae bacterium]|nr:hypothetical protein [Halobacteriovoraceae bacterium]